MKPFEGAALRTQKLTKRWGAFCANDSVDLHVAAGSRHALIGPNGAGKTTLVNLLTGIVAPTSGDVYVGEERVTRTSAHARVSKGLVRTFQINSLFPALTVLETVVMAICERNGQGLNWRQPLATRNAEVQEARTLLATLRLDAEESHRAEVLAYGKQRLLEIAVALAMKPRILLLDEPAAGLPGQDSQELFRVISALPRNVTVVFIEHDMDLVFRFADRITVLVAGKVLVDGTPEEIAANAEVKQVYLGEGRHGQAS